MDPHRDFPEGEPVSRRRIARRLAAILSADVCGFSRLVEADEEGTRAKLSAAQAMTGCIVVKFGGRIVDAVGDNVLAEFPSAVNAVQAAVSIQENLSASGIMRGGGLRFRIGINIGDVAAEGDKIFGEGINIAARLQALADPGGICVAGNVIEQVARRLPFEFQRLGRFRLRNISLAVSVFRVIANSDRTRIPGSRLGAYLPSDQAAWLKFLARACTITILIALLLLGLHIDAKLDAVK
jgi:adenylate cyclase